MRELPAAVREVLESGVFCHVAASTPSGPHVTPAVFAVAGGRVWVTTARRSVKAGAWRADPRAAGLVRAGRSAVAFAGRAATHDVLDPSTWARSAARTPALTVATARFTRKNARFFAGYAVDARRVPLAWTPPGRVFVELALDRVALLEPHRPPRTWGAWPVADGAPPSAPRFRAARAGAPPTAALPGDVAERLGARGEGALALEVDGGPVVLPAAWTVDGAALYAVADAATVALAGLGSERPRAALAMDRPSSWRASEMVGAMARGQAVLHVAAALAGGAASARRIAAAAGADGHAAVVARVRPERLVWWRGWTSGTVTP